MPAEIQVFMLCAEVQDTADGLNLLGACQNELLTNVFPAEVELRCFMQLRKETADAVPPINIEIRIRNQDGHNVYGPFNSQFTFGGGHRFGTAKVVIHPTFPAPNDYSITARISDEGHASECRYDIGVYHEEPPAQN